MQRIVSAKGAALVAAVLSSSALGAPGDAVPTFNSKPWLDDLDQVHEVLATKYANLEWAVFQREANLPKLFTDTKARIEAAASDDEARAALDRLARKLGDGHVVFDWPRAAKAVAATYVQPDRCSGLGYDPRMRAEPLAANVVGYHSLATPQTDELPAGVIDFDGRRVGVLQIGIFSPKGFPALCQAALQALAIPADKPCEETCGDKVEDWAVARMTHNVETQLRALEGAGAVTLVVDIAGNGGGSEWAEAVARMLTPRRLKSERMGFVRGEHWAKAFADDELALRNYADNETGQDRALLLGLAQAAEAKREVALTPCNSAPLWQRAHLACSWLGQGFFGSGYLASADPSELRGKPWASLVFTPMEFPYEEGVWRRPLIVLVDRNTGSAAAEFAAVLQDNRAAIILGEPADGGCGHTNGGTPTTLRNSGGILEVPDCVRFRQDGSNEVMGVEPDVLVGFTAVDGQHLRATRFLAKLPDAVRSAAALND